MRLAELEDHGANEYVSRLQFRNPDIDFGFRLLSPPAGVSVGEESLYKCHNSHCEIVTINK